MLDGWLSGPATVLGIGALLTAFGVAAMRTQTLLHSIVLLTPVIPLVAYAAERLARRRQRARTSPSAPSEQCSR